jgi:hypothetical protein
VSDKPSATDSSPIKTSEPAARISPVPDHHEKPAGLRAFTRSPWITEGWCLTCRAAARLADVGRKTATVVSLHRVQATVAVVTGLVTIAVGISSLMQHSGPAPGIGEVVTIVQDAASAKGVPDATIEILTPKNALVATLTPDAAGRARQSLQEGRYVVRVKHPSYASEVRDIQVFPKQVLEIKASLRAGSDPHVKGMVGDGARAVRRALHF